MKKTLKSEIKKMQKNEKKNKKNEKKNKKNEKTKRKNNKYEKAKKIEKTKKKYNEKKKILWNSFHKNINEKKKLECLYTKCENKKRTKCDICEYDVALNNENFLVCTNNNCGLIYKDILILTPEWGNYNNSDKKGLRCGIPINNLLKQSSYGCKVICNNNSSYEMKKIRRYTEWQAMPYKEKSQYEEFEIIKTMSKISGISKRIIDDALIYHKKFSEMKTFRGVNREGIIAASIYISSKINGWPRTAKEISIIFNLNKTAATKGCKNAIYLLNNLETDIKIDDKVIFCETKPIVFIERFCSKLNINKQITKLCQFVSIKIENKNLLLENTPHSIAAGIIYFVSYNCDLNISKNDVYGITEISKVTINKCFKKLQIFKEILIPKAMLNKYNKK